MSRRRPWRVPAGTTEYTVRERHEPRARDGERVQGLTELGDRTITLDTSQSDRAMVLTFWHEWLHAALHENGYDKSGDDEAFVEAMAQSLTRAVLAAPKRFKS